MRLILTALSTLIALLAMSDDKPCGPIDQVEAKLAPQYQEVHTIEGVTDQVPLLLIYRSKDGKTFTVVLVRAEDKMACLVASGSNLLIKKP
jgi:hypothetical protein